MKKSSINVLIDLFLRGFEGISIKNEVIEKLAVTVHQCMSSTNRNFHTVEHLEEMCRGLSGIKVISILFHDVVYYQVDRGILQALEPHLKGIFDIDGEKMEMTLLEKSDECYDLCKEIFGFSTGKVLTPFSGFNEFASAVIAVKMLCDILSRKDMIDVLACIEGTIPFRPLNDSGLSSFDQLYARLSEINKRDNVFESEGDVKRVVKDAVSVSNRDIRNFADDDIRYFLDKTWSLLPESNGHFKLTDAYSVVDYRVALQKMEGFLSFLQSENIFRTFDGSPDRRSMEILLNASEKNLLIAREYFEIKLLTIGIIESLAMLSGGDAPLSMFMGSLSIQGKIVKRVEQYLPLIRTSPDLDYNEDIIMLAEFGRIEEIGFDLKNSPVSSFIYRLLGREAVGAEVKRCKQMFEGTINYVQFFNGLDEKLKTPLLKAFSKVVEIRSERLMDLC